MHVYLDVAVVMYICYVGVVFPDHHPWVKRSRGYEGYGGYPVSEWMSD